MVKDIVNKINKDSKNKVAPLQQEYEMLKKNIVAIEVKKDKVLGLYEESLISKDDLYSRLARLNEEKELLESRIISITQILS